MDSNRGHNTLLGEPQIDYYYNSLEEQLRNEFHDSKARLIPSETEGRIILEIEEVLLDDFMERLLNKEDNNWGNQKKLMPDKINRMKAQLAQAKQVPSSEMEELKAQQREISGKLNKAQREPEQQTSNCQCLQAQLEKMKEKNVDLHGNLENLTGENRDLLAKLQETGDLQASLNKVVEEKEE